MMVSIATGQNSFYLPYLSIDNVQNNHHHIYKNISVLIGFLAMPKSKYIYIYLLLSIIFTLYLAKQALAKTNEFQCFYC